MEKSYVWQKIYPRAVRAEKDFAMLCPGDRILVGLSGGADSLALLSLLAYQYKKIGISLKFSLIPGHIPGTYRGRPTAEIDRLEQVCRQLGLELYLSSHRLPDYVFTDCFRCSQARRRLLFDLAEENGCNKIALGHNADDLVETLLLNAFYSGRLASLSPAQPVLRGKLTIIRPLCYVWKDDISRFSQGRFGRPSGFGCPSSRNSQRLVIRRILDWMSRDNPHLKGNLLKAICNPRLEYLPVPSGRL